MNEIFIVWEDDYDAGSEMRAIFSDEDEAIEFAEKVVASSVERYELPAILDESYITEEVWSQ